MNELIKAEQEQSAGPPLQSGNAAANYGKFLTFQVGDGVYGIDILRVKEIIEFSEVTRVPMAPATIRGVLNLRGNVVPVVDLAVRLGKTTTLGNRACNIVVEMRDGDTVMSLGFVVDAVNQVVDIREDQVEPAPPFGADVRTDFIAGIGKLNERFVVLLDIEQVLSVDELSNL